MQGSLFHTGKICRHCKKAKPLEKFYKNERGFNGRSSYCKQCEIEKVKSRYTSVEETKKECVYCSKSFSSKYSRKYCDECINNNNSVKNKCRVYYFECKGCGKLSVTGQERRANYCTHECYSENRSNYEFDCKCITCGREYKSKSSTSKYCDIKCRKTKTNIYTGICDNCGDPFVSRYKRKYCSEECGGYEKVKPFERECDKCGISYISNHGNSKYCYECIKDIKRAFSRDRKGYRRRAKLFDCVYQKISREKVFTRDKYKCNSCGVKTLKSKAGTNHDREPTLDHIIPMSKGGPHTYNNVQTLCRKCNTDKSNNIIGQMPIIYQTKGRGAIFPTD